MAIIIKRRKMYSVVYESKTKTCWETYFNYEEAVARKQQIEDNKEDYFKVSANMLLRDYLSSYCSIIGYQIWHNSTCDGYVGVLHNYIIHVIGNSKIKDISKSFSDKFMDEIEHMQGIGKRNQEATEYIPYSVKRKILILMQSACDYLISLGYLHDNPFTDYQVYEENKIAVKVNHKWTLAIFRQLLDACEDPKLYVFLNLLFGCGLSIEEALAVTWTDVDINDGILWNGNCMLTVDKKLKRVNKEYLNRIEDEQIITIFQSKYFAHTNTCLISEKTDQKRCVKVNKSIGLVLTEWKRLQKNDLIKTRCDENLILCFPDGSPYDQRSATKHFKALRDKAELPPVTLASLRFFGMQNAKRFYPCELVLPIPSLNYHTLDILETNKSFAKYIPENKEQAEIRALVNMLKQSDEMKEELIHRLKAGIK